MKVLRKPGPKPYAYANAVQMSFYRTHAASRDAMSTPFVRVSFFLVPAALSR